MLKLSCTSILQLLEWGVVLLCAPLIMLPAKVWSFSLCVFHA